MAGEEDIPWTLKGVSEEARGVARKAAERAGQSMGEWLSETIRITDVEEQWAARGGEASDSPADAEALRTAVTLLERRMTEMERRLDEILAAIRARPEPAEGDDDHGSD